MPSTSNTTEIFKNISKYSRYISRISRIYLNIQDIYPGYSRIYLNIQDIYSGY